MVVVTTSSASIYDRLKLKIGSQVGFCYPCSYGLIDSLFDKSGETTRMCGVERAGKYGSDRAETSFVKLHLSQIVSQVEKNWPLNY